MSFFSEQLGRLQKAGQQAQRNHGDVEEAAQAFVAEIKVCWGMHAGVRFGIANALDFTPGKVGALTDDLRSEFLVDVEFRGEDGGAWNVRLPVVATLTRAGVSMAMKGGSGHRVSAARAASFHPVIAELESATDNWITEIERGVQPK